MRFAAALPHARAFLPRAAESGWREKNRAENKAISGRSADGVTVTRSASGEWSEFIPILPADVASLSGGSQAAGGQAVTVFRSLGSKTDPVLHVRFPAPWSVVAENRRKSKLAEREGFEPSIPDLVQYDGLANRCLQPLGHLSNRYKAATTIR